MHFRQPLLILYGLALNFRLLFHAARPPSVICGILPTERAIYDLGTERMTSYSMTGLYEGEQLTLDFGTGSPVVPRDRKSINAKYVKGEVRIITEQARYPLPSVVGMYEDGKAYVLNSDFQRRHRWNR